MEKQIISKKIKILLGATVIVIAFLLLKIGTQKKVDEINIDVTAESSESVKDIIVEETIAEGAIPQDDTYFSKYLEGISQQADAAISWDWSEKNIAITKIGEKIQHILSSDYAETFEKKVSIGDNLSFYIEDYPLQSGLIRRVVYTLNPEGEDSQWDTRSFLQYIGENTFFSDIEYVYDMRSNGELQVFENKDGCFAFILSKGYEEKLFGSNERFSEPYATVYILGNEGFSIEKDVSIPIKVAAGREFNLVQQDDIIKGIISDYTYSQECIFNPEKLAFELPNPNIKSDSLDYTIANLLLGLSDSRGNMRTLFIRMEADKIYTTEYADQIIFTRKNGLYSVKPYIRYEEFYQNYSNEENIFQIGHTDIKKLLCGPLGNDLTESFNSIFGAGETEWVYYELTDIPLFLGEDYICYIQKTYESGGGSFHASDSNVRFDKLDKLSDFKMDRWLQPNFKEEKVADLAYGAKAKELYKEDVDTYGGNLSTYVDFKQLSVKRNLGKWSYMLPITEEYFHPGNGSYIKNITGFAAYDNDVSSIIDTNHEFVTLGGWINWDAKDIFKFPQTDVELAQFDYFLGIYQNGAGYWEYDIYIPVSLDEYIVSISFINDDERAVLNQYEEKPTQTKSIGHNVSWWAKIHEELSGFSFNIHGENKDSLYSAKKLSIYYEYELLQEFEFEYNESIGGYPQSSSENFGFVIEDMNFDGYKDIRLIYYVPTAPNISYLYWVWNVEAGMFIKDSDLGEVLSPSFDYENELVLSHQRGSATDHYIFTYRYIDEKLTLIKREETGFINDKDKENTYLMEYELIDGEWQIMKEEQIELK